MKGPGSALQMLLVYIPRITGFSCIHPYCSSYGRQPTEQPLSTYGSQHQDYKPFVFFTYIDAVNFIDSFLKNDNSIRKTSRDMKLFVDWWRKENDVIHVPQ